ncbi:hypothetical protein FRB90_006050 [Tulasnella sp. 427]|nr:hypothetical protein FRB90_006050 [Tulasnella sp. 427]
MIVPAPATGISQREARLREAELNMKLGTMYTLQSDTRSASDCYTMAIAIFTGYGLVERRVAGLEALANVHLRQNAYDEALKLYSDALQIRIDIGDKVGSAVPLWGLAQVHLMHNHYDEAAKLYSDVLQIGTDVGDRAGRASALGGLADIYRRQNEYDKAVKLYSEELQLRTDIGDRGGEASALWSLALINRLQHQYDDAAKLYSEALQICKDIGDRAVGAGALWGLAEVHRMRNEYDTATKLYSESLQISTEIGDKDGRASVLYSLGDIYLAQSKYDEAARLYDEALQIRTDIGDERGRACILLALADVYYSQDELHKAVKAYSEALQIFKEVGYRDGVSFVSERLAKTQGLQTPMQPIEVPPFQLQPLISDLPQPPPQTASRPGHGSTNSGDFDSFIRSTTEGALSNLASAPLFSRVMGGANATARGSTTAAPSESARQQQPSGREVKCVQAYNRDIVVGCTDGTLIRYSVRDDDTASGDPYSIASLQTVPGGKAIEKIALVPALNKALVLSGGVIHFYTFPALDPLPASIISPLRGATEFAIDETAVQVCNNAAPNQNIPPIRLCVVRRRVVVVYALRDRLSQLKDIPFPNGAIRACLSGPHLCVADPKSYWIVNIDAGEALELMEWSQDQSLPPRHVKPLIAISDPSEFMLAIWTGNGALGFFMTGNGDPTRGTLDYPQHPLSICIDYPYVAALLPNGTVEIHSIVTLSIVAVLSCPTTLQPCLLSSSNGGYLVPSLQRNSAIKPAVIPLLNPPPSTPTKSRSRDNPTSPPSGSGLTPPSTPVPQPSLKRSVSGRSTKSISEASYSRSGTLVAGLRGMHSLLPSTLGSQIDSLLESNRMQDAVDLLSQVREKLEKSTGVVDEGEIREVLLIHQRIAFRYLFATSFEDAGKHFLLGKTDPRLLVRLFPELRGDVITSSEELAVFAGVVDQARAFDSIDSIIRNYHPHIQPSIEEATPTVELRRVLNMTARDMLASFLKKSRDNVASLVVDPLDVGKVQKIVDTTLLKLHIEENQTPQMMTLVNMSENIIFSEVEALLIQNHKFTVLSKLYEKKGDDSKLLEIWTKVVDGEWKDPALANPLPRIKELLLETKDRVLVQRYGIWLIKHDPEASLRLFTTKDSKRGMKLDENLILRALRAADAEVGEKYLEHLILVRRNAEPTLSTLLAVSYLERIISALGKPEVMESWTATLTKYSKTRVAPSDGSATSIPLLQYLATLTELEQLPTRIKLCLFLQGSNYYDLEALRGRLEGVEDKNSFPLETAIVYGRIGKHDGALSILVHSLKDSTTAEAYCTLGGDVIPPKVASAVAQQVGIEAWGQLVTANSPGYGLATAPGRGQTTAGRSSSARAPVSEDTKKALISTLMRVYMKGGDGMAQETAQLLNAQAINLDVVDVLDSVPSTWSLNVMSSFVSRSLRRTLHDHQEGLLIKAIASAQNLDISDMAFEAMREEGAMVEEALDSGTEAGDDLNEKQPFGEDEFISEKVPYLDDETHFVVQPIPIRLRDSRHGAAGSLDSSKSTLQ